MELAEHLATVKEDLPNQRVVRLDALRTRAEMPWFREEATQQRIVSVLTYFCKERGVKYKQGLNEVLAPVMSMRVNNVTAYRLLVAIVDRVCLSFCLLVICHSVSPPLSLRLCVHLSCRNR